MKHILLILFILSLTSAVSGQKVLEIQPNPFESTFPVDLNDYWAEPIAHSRIKNVSESTINLRWEREIINAPAAWEFRICDTVACYTSSVLSNVVIGGQPNVPIPVPKNESTLLDLHVLPRGVVGCAEVRLKLSDASNPANILNTAVYKVCISSLTSTTEVDNNSLKIYPNPATNYISLSRNTAVRQLWISNILGKRVKTFLTSGNGRYDISELPDGIYMVSMVDAKGSIFKTVRLSKRIPRP